MLGALLLAAAAAAVQASSAPTSYDFFLLVLQYAPALCGASLKCPGITPSWSYFTLHGLWPENKDGTYPQNCGNSKFDPAAVANITTELDKYWVSLAGPSETFWAHGALSCPLPKLTPWALHFHMLRTQPPWTLHFTLTRTPSTLPHLAEYEKHGTCAVDVYPSEFSFMNSTLALRAKYDITPALAAAGIVPSATATFTPAQFQAAVTQAFGFPALLACDNTGDITGAVVCVSKQGKAQSCGSVTYGTCSASQLRLVLPK